MLCPTPPERLTDAQGRPYFLWDLDLSLAELREKLADPDVGTRAYWLGRVMRDAKPDDVFLFASLARDPRPLGRRPAVPRTVARVLGVAARDLP